jgi:hypothetical protein
LHQKRQFQNCIIPCSMNIYVCHLSPSFSIPSFVALCFMCGSNKSGLITGTKQVFNSGPGCRNGTRFVLELDGRAGVSTVCFFIGGVQQPYRVTRVPRGVRFGVCWFLFLFFSQFVLFCSVCFYFLYFSSFSLFR